MTSLDCIDKPDDERVVDFRVLDAGRDGAEVAGEVITELQQDGAALLSVAVDVEHRQAERHTGSLKQETN